MQFRLVNFAILIPNNSLDYNRYIFSFFESCNYLFILFLSWLTLYSFSGSTSSSFSRTLVCKNVSIEICFALPFSSYIPCKLFCCYFVSKVRSFLALPILYSYSFQNANYNSIRDFDTYMLSNLGHR